MSEWFMVHSLWFIVHGKKEPLTLAIDNLS